MPEFVIDGESFDEAVRGLFEAADRVDVEVTRTVLEIAASVSTTAKKIAGEHSAKVAATVSAPIPIRHGAAVRAGSADVPLAALWELGNKGKGNRRKPTFRHPVYGHWNVQDPTRLDQVRHPFLAPARKLLRPVITERMGAAWEHALAPFERGNSHV